MKTLAVMSRKGGAGKTTVAVNLMLAARAMGVNAVLADADPLRSACEVLKGREDAASLLFETSAAKLFALAEASRRDGAELLIVDTPSGPEADVAEAVKVADLCLAVVRPTYLDLTAAVISVAVIRRLGKAGLIVLNQCPAVRGSVEAPTVVDAFEALRDAGFPTTPTVLRSRLVYQSSFAERRAVLEVDPAGAAAFEVRDLFGQVWRRLHGEAAAPLANANANANDGGEGARPAQVLSFPARPQAGKGA